jgi:hypothetical protein
MNFNLLVEKYLNDLNLAILNHTCEKDFGLPEETCNKAFGIFNQLQYFLIPAIFDYFIETGKIDSTRKSESMESKMMWMMTNTNVAKKLRNFANLTQDFDEIFGVHSVNELVEFLLDYPKDYDVWHGEFKAHEEKYKIIAKNLVVAMMDDPSHKISIV